MNILIRILLVAVVATPLFAQRASIEPFVFTLANGERVEAEKGSFTVPENRTKPDSRRLTLRFVRFRSTSATPGSPIVYLAGGPGGSGIGAAAGQRFALFSALREFGDVIAFDQRGTGQSEPDSRCSEQYALPLDRPIDPAAAGAAMAEAARRCAERLKTIDTAALNTRESAADLNDLRIALGATKLTLWGISYGTHLAIATLRFHPDAIDRVILAGIEGPDDTYKLPSDQQDLLEEIARLAYHAGVAHDLLASIRRVSRELEARPKQVALTDPRDGKAVTVTLGVSDLRWMLAEMLTGPDAFAAMPDVISRLEGGDWTALALSVAPLRSGAALPLMSIAMDCASGRTAARARRIAAEAPATLLGDVINAPMPAICEGVAFADLGDAFRAPLESAAVPALLISGTLDGRTRPRQAEELRLTLPNAQHLVIEGAGHSDPLFLSSPKILDAMKTFLRGETVTERHVTLPPMKFLPVRRVVRVDDAVLARHAGVYRFPEGIVRRVLAAGSVLYVMREGSQPLPVRPMSAQTFFYEGQAAEVRFEDGVMFFRGADGREQKGIRDQR